MTSDATPPQPRGTLARVPPVRTDRERTERVEVKMSAAERVDIEAAARFGGEDTSQLLRRLALTYARKLLRRYPPPQK